MKPLWQGTRDLVSRGFNLPLIQKSRLQWVDYLRGIAIILIVYRHVLVGIERGNIEMPTVLVNANMIFYSFRMPLFFILSGIFIGGSLAKKSLKELIGIKFEKTFLSIPHLVHYPDHTPDLLFRRDKLQQVLARLYIHILSTSSSRSVLVPACTFLMQRSFTCS